MKLRMFKAACATVAAFGLSLAVTAPPAYADTTVQAENGTIVDEDCGDDGPMAVESGGSGQVVFHPGTLCSQAFAKVSVTATATSIRAKFTGQSGELCGTFTFAGSIVATTGEVCASDADFYTYSVTGSSSGTGTYTVTWTTSTGTPTWVNAYVDWHTLSS